MARRGDNSEGTVKPVSVDSADDRLLFESFPKRVRLRLIEGKYDYAAADVKAAFDECMKFCQDPEESWWRVIEMVDRNDRDQGKLERQMYESLVVEFAEDKRQRIANAFIKAS
jgi:hypothetical protein